MRNSMFKVVPLAIAAAVALAACGKKEEAPAPKAEPAKAAEAPAEVIKIGHVGPLTGGIAHLGKDNENGARLAVEEINAAGGLKVGDKTYKFELVAEDDKADPKEGTLAAQKIVDSGAVAIVGHLNSGTTIPASKIYADANVTQISPSANCVTWAEPSGQPRQAQISSANGRLAFPEKILNRSGVTGRRGSAAAISPQSREPPGSAASARGTLPGSQTRTERPTPFEKEGGPVPSSPGR